MRSLAVLVRLVAVVLGAGRVLFGLIVLAVVVVVRRLAMVVRRGLMVGRRLVVRLTCCMLLSFGHWDNSFLNEGDLALLHSGIQGTAPRRPGWQPVELVPRRSLNTIVHNQDGLGADLVWFSNCASCSRLRRWHADEARPPLPGETPDADARGDTQAP